MLLLLIGLKDNYIEEKNIKIFGIGVQTSYTLAELVKLAPPPPASLVPLGLNCYICRTEIKDIQVVEDELKSGKSTLEDIDNA